MAKADKKVNATQTDTAKATAEVVANPAKVPTIAAGIAGQMLTISFSNGDVIELNAAMLSEDIRQQAMMHGLKQKLVDAAAIARDTETGRSATLADKIAAIKEVADRLTTEGMWNKVRDGGAGTGNNLLQKALMELTGKTREAIEAWLEPKSKEEKAALRKNEKVAAIIVRMQVASADSSIDTDAMLADIG